MNFETQQFNEVVENLRPHRDEINVQMHLAKAELKNEWNGVEKKWDTLQSKYSALKKETAESTKEVGTALSLLAEQIGLSYQRIKQRLKN